MNLLCQGILAKIRLNRSKLVRFVSCGKYSIKPKLYQRSLKIILSNVSWTLVQHYGAKALSPNFEDSLDC